MKYKILKFLCYFLPYCIFVKIFMKTKPEYELPMVINGKEEQIPAWRISKGLFISRPFGDQLNYEIKQTKLNIKNLERQKNTIYICGGNFDEYGEENE